MVIKVYTSGISGNKEVKKRQQRIFMVLESKNIEFEAIDITEPENEEQKHFMQEHALKKGARNAIPPQIFNESEYCGDYEGFDVANENDELEEFLKMPRPKPVPNGIKEETVHGFCYTPSLAKRLEKAIKACLTKPKPPKQLDEDAEMDGEILEDEEEIEMQEDASMKNGDDEKIEAEYIQGEE